MDAVKKIGYPECRIILAQTVIYLATSPKSNASYMAIDKALAMAEQTVHLPVPLALRNSPTKLMKEIGYGKDYRYSHDYEGNFTQQNFLPEELKGQIFYQPGNNPRENQLKTKLEAWWKDWYLY
jgi:putative ATPase